MKVSAFKLADLAEIDVQDAQRRELLNGIGGAEILEGHPAYTAREGARIIAIAGVVQLDRDVGLLWALIARNVGRLFVRLHRAVYRVMQVAGFARVLSLTACDFVAGCRWLELLGFKKVDEQPVSLQTGHYWVYARAVP